MKLLVVILKRLVWLVPTVLGVIIITFVISHIIPADPVRLAAGATATPEQIAELRHELGYDQPLWMQLLMYLRDLAQGNMGESLFTGRAVSEDLMSRMPATIELTVAAMVLTVFIGIPLGVVSALRRNSLMDHIVRVVTVSGLAVASFWLGIMLQLAFSMRLGWIPLGGRIEGFPPHEITGLLLVDAVLTWDWPAFWNALRHLMLPTLTLAVPPLATVVRFTRSGVLDVMQTPYILYEQAMGFPRPLVVWKYILRNALISTVTQIGLLFGIMLAGAVVIEAVFDWPGLGYYAVNSIVLSDYQAILGFTVWAGVAYILVNMVVDVVHVVIDPRESVQ